MTPVTTSTDPRFRITRSTLLNLLCCFLFCLSAPFSALRAADAPQQTAAAHAPDPLSTHNKYLYRGLKAIPLHTAQQMPEEKYAFKPAESVRTFGQIVGHLADSHSISSFPARIIGSLISCRAVVPVTS